ncbi:hypothetical protein EW145_g5028 [Phellinidium pouzarii]|uniref:Methyltransferase domain-containing protein n=1 Tax=Phellinidium pouzarii TaxID=167371 RepID=A0A4S4L1F0_9AGAM|nr:hypothetical protein EW145_g5028 [Phellinidium pouzarii]
MASHGIRSPPPPSDASSSRPKFDTETLKAYIKKLLSTTLQNEAFPSPRDRDRTKAWCKEIGERVKERMIGMYLSLILCFKLAYSDAVDVRDTAERLGYDAVFIASVLDYYVLGIDLSPSAVDAANAYAQKVVTLNDSARDRVMFRATDFFNFAIEEEERFDVVFDHTFFCAIPPSLRSAWGQEMAALLTPGGFLITLVFPIDGSREGGPPYSVSVDIYAQALGSHWTKTLDKIPSESSPSHEGRERLVIWRKNLYL